MTALIRDAWTYVLLVIDTHRKLWRLRRLI